MMTFDNAVTLLCTTLREYWGENNTDFDLIFPHCNLVEFQPKTYLHDADAVATDIFFICKGLVRIFYITEDGKEYNKTFGEEGAMLGAIQSAVKAEPSRYHIQALEPVIALSIPIEQLNRLYAESLVWANIGRKAMESLAVRKEKREAQFLLDSAESRYRQFLEDSPQLIARLPLYHIASYLGITDVALSRLRRKIHS
ncbi:hypothetical protein A9Q99_19595 [Gammaproteobacteria bacterium 45_16_T64]|nr:hypothetical protein A9Q99_19595 [Gammaproteobacteria bacterium 45_16_T64]